MRMARRSSRGGLGPSWRRCRMANQPFFLMILRSRRSRPPFAKRCVIPGRMPLYVPMRRGLAPNDSRGSSPPRSPRRLRADHGEWGGRKRQPEQLGLNGVVDSILSELPNHRGQCPRTLLPRELLRVLDAAFPKIFTECGISEHGARCASDVGGIARVTIER